MTTLIPSKLVRSAGVALSLSFTSLFVGGCVSGTADSGVDADEDTDRDEAAVSKGILARGANTKVRVASWNVMLGSIFEKDEDRLIYRNGGKASDARITTGPRVIKAIDADIWLLQEVAYHDKAKPGEDWWGKRGIVESTVEGYMKKHLGGTWDAKCNGHGLCTVVRTDKGIKISQSCMTEELRRYNSHLVTLKDGGGTASLVVANVHFAPGGDTGNDAEAKMFKDSKASGHLIGGDFNAVKNGHRWGLFKDMGPRNLVQLYDEKATHLTQEAKGATILNHGNTHFDNGLLKAAQPDDKQYDFMFLKDNGGSWAVVKEFGLNTMRLSKAALKNNGLKPADVALKPDELENDEFKDFMSTGKVKSVDFSVFHDHLPMVVDLKFKANNVATSLDCSK